MNHDEKADQFKVDQSVQSASAEEFDGLVLPEASPIPIRSALAKTRLASSVIFFKQGKPVAAICHGPWTLIEADVVRGRRSLHGQALRPT